MVVPMLPPQAPPMIPPGSPPLPMGGDPSALPPSSIIDADYQLLVAREEAAIGPEPPPWYIPLPKPTAKQIMDEAQEQKQLHAIRVQTQASMDLRLGMEISAIFDADQMWVDLKEIEPQASPLLRIMHDAICNFIAAQTLQHTSLAHGLVHREERAAIEAHLDDSHEDWAERHFREGQGDLMRTITADALSGMVAIYHAPDPSNPRSGQRLYRVDPKTVYPVFGRDGLDCVYMVYDATCGEILRDFSDGVDEAGKPNPKTRKIQQIARKGKGAGNSRIDPETTQEFIGYWDRERAVLTWGGEVIAEWRHGLYVCPWHIFVPNWRQRGGTKASGGYQMGDRSGPLISVDGISVPYTGVTHGATRQTDLARMYEPFLTAWIAVADRVEKALTRTTYGVDRALDWPTVWKRASGNSGQGAPEIQNYRGGVTEIEQDEELDVLPMNPLNDSFEPWMKLMEIELQMAIPSVLMQGQNIGTQASGNSLDTIMELGLGMFSPVPAFMQRLFSEVDHRNLTYIKDWNPTYGTDAAEGLAVPRRGGSYGPPMRLTAEMLERAGCYVKASLNRLSLAGMAATATTIATLDQQVHLGTRRLWGQLVGFPNPQQIDDDRRQQDLEDTPGFVEGRAIEYLYETMKEAAALEDEESFKYAYALSQRVAAKQTMHDMALAKMSGMLPAQPEPLPGELPEAGPGNPAPYLSAPEQGQTTGTDGGAPATSAGPLAIPGQGG